MSAEPLRQRAHHLYHRKGRSVYRIAWQLDLPFDEVLALVRDSREAPGPPPEPKPRRVKVKLEAVAGCGCVDRKLCPKHQAKLDEMRKR